VINIPVEKIDKAVIESLVADSVPESRTLEYKERLPGKSEQDKHEFLADVTAIANASGGDLVYGIKEKRDTENKPTGEPEEACGVGLLNLDEEIRRLENLLRNGIDPRISGLLCHRVDGFRDGPVIVYRIPKSWASPHMIRSSSRFYSRTTREKYPLDVREIRAAFALSEALPERIRRFRDDRLVKIIAGETPVSLIPGTRVVLQILPIASFDSATVVNIASIRDPSLMLQPFRAAGWDGRFNFDGYVTFTGRRDSTAIDSYVQLFRSGAIEAITASLCAEWQGNKGIPSGVFETELIQTVEKYLTTLKNLEFAPPLFILISFLNVKGYSMSVGMNHWSRTAAPIDRDTLLLPEIVLDSYETNIPGLLRSAFDAVWQACGWERSIHFDTGGNWNPVV
jgi:hypothetical protein